MIVLLDSKMILNGNSLLETDINLNKTVSLDSPE